MESEKELLDEFQRLAIAVLILHGIDGYRSSGGAFVNAYVGTLQLHVSTKRLTVYMSVGGGRSDYVYSADGQGVCNGRHLPLLGAAMTIMKTSVVLDELARI